MKLKLQVVIPDTGLNASSHVQVILSMKPIPCWAILVDSNSMLELYINNFW